MTILDILNAWCGMCTGIEVCDPANNPIGSWKVNKLNSFKIPPESEYKDIPEEVLNMEVKNFTLRDNYYLLFYTK